MIFTDEELALLDETRKILHDKMVRTPCYNGPESVKLYLQTKLANYANEAFGLLLLDNQNQLIEDAILFTGTIDCCSVYPRVVVEKVLTTGAASCIVYHNHPSFDSTPSESDKAITRQLSAALKLIDVSIIDHFVVGRTVYSFAERGLL